MPTTANPPSTHTLRLILGDQLNPQHPWFAQVDAGVVYVLMEIRQETDYVLHHAQKIIAIFAAMRALARQLAQAGHRVHYLQINDPANQHSLPANLGALIERYQPRQFDYQDPDEYRLDQHLKDFFASRPYAARVNSSQVDSKHFYTQRHEAAELFAQRKQWLMEHFYRHMRLRHRVLIDGMDKPAGGQWNFDAENRKPWKGAPPEPPDLRPRHDHSTLWASIEAAGVQSFGEPSADNLRWPLNRTEAVQQLEHFICHALPHFGDYQDAMSRKAWRLFHSLLSFALNVKMLNPREVVERVEAEWRAGRVELAAAEGFVRQIIGWREYVRGIYWAQMPGYDQHNGFEHNTPLPKWFWTGNTRMNCLAASITGSLQHAHAHHIQRLMVIGNFALLAGLDPQALHRWYLGVYIDAFEWVELPNTLGMSQFADGGLLATKPYVSSAAYIDRMSDYCKGCAYDKKQRLGEAACPFNALYWDFYQRNADPLKKNPRIGMAYQHIARMDADTLAALQARASQIRGQLDAL
ncbi:cryptochrome/photolyase family protein [Rhodoferax fermentans]|uniref:Cryptochrome/photolyase family protein n=1 Tax=Rhodoferax fermentans TaxID=28066 RepID=A0A1T1AWK9_RHOFE|nr:cryptochrome/photolyase family protein [Rhodoferax fermentans]MBK1681953.1 cryptochrome/photolyase family protein [Rhodoferax fermentans]OOV08512.1 cryptochrome/photolyase family protein [Rhodoferax fermentans]